jgi:UDP-N-acetylmuramyl tripeptide synthase
MQLALEDSRRLTGPNLVTEGPGAVLEVRVEGGPSDSLVEAWRTRAAEILTAVGWPAERTYVRAHLTGVSLALSAPIDALYAATEVNEWALDAAVSDMNGEPPAEDCASATARLRSVIAEETNPALLTLRDAAARHGVMFLSDDGEASVGMGAGSRTWPVDELPGPDDVPWDEIHDVPLVLVTGTNGKTTTVRLLAAAVRASGRTPGFSSTDGVYVGSELADGGDYSGPEGARTVLRDQRVQAAILETARGGMLRRGLAVPRADGALVSNVGVDHMGEYGLHDIDEMADAKLVIAKAVISGGTLVLNADDPVLARRGAPDQATLVWTSKDCTCTPVQVHVAGGGSAVVADGASFVRLTGGRRTEVLPIADVPLTLGGAAGYNIDNVLAALALAPALGIDDAQACVALREFVPSPDMLPGRTNIFQLDGVTAIVDFAHNPHGLAALAGTVLSLPASRRLVVIGQAGDRDDESIRELTRAAVEMAPHRIIIKELSRYLRGREPGEVPGIIADELTRLGTSAEVVLSDGELSAVRDALEWCEPGDLLVFPIQAERAAITELLDRLLESSWSPGSPLPKT